MSKVIVIAKDGTTTEHKLIFNKETKIYEVFPKVDESDIYWNSYKQVKIEYK